MQDNNTCKCPDLLGLHALDKLILKLGESYSKDTVSQLRLAYDASENALVSLGDRYARLKDTCHQLAEELSWLRDQCDDFVLEKADLMDEILRLKNKSETSSHSRYDD